MAIIVEIRMEGKSGGDQEGVTSMSIYRTTSPSRGERGSPSDTVHPRTGKSIGNAVGPVGDN